MTDMHDDFDGWEPSPEELHEFFSGDEGELGDPFDGLHPLVRDAAQDCWDREDFPGAVKTAWMALRDEIRTRTGKPDLDNVELIDGGIGETNPRLPLTDYVTETDKNMHRGLVNFLRGIAFYVRHPEAHETESPVKDREGALERLAVMSLCARHVVAAAAPTAIEDAVAELQQTRFPRRREAYADLLRRIPPRRHREFASKVLAAAAEAYVNESEALRLWRRCIGTRLSGPPTRQSLAPPPSNSGD
jgi:uncharacterized protein (TIGR02391 family)